ncbi:MAG: GxxExxY protein [Anaerolineae bacterium]
MDMKEPDQSLDQLARAVIGAAIDVHRELGPGYLEVVYQNALCHELRLRNIYFESQAPVNITYKGHPVGEGRIDILVENKLIVELKAVEAFEKVHHAQVISYLKATDLILDLLINFNVPVLKDAVRRIILSQ